MKKNIRSHIATAIGVLGAVVNAVVSGIDVSTFDVHSTRDWLKVVWIVAPIIVGAFTEVKSKKVKDEGQ